MLAKAFSPRVLLLAGAVAVSVVALMAVSFYLPFLNRAESYSQDLLMRETAVKTDPDLVLLGLDEDSLTLSAVEPEEVAGSRALQLMEQGYPLPREVYALAAERLLAAGAKVVILDLVYPVPREGDEIFAEALRSAGGRLIIGSNFEHKIVGNQNLVSYVPPTPTLAQAAGPHVGYVNLSPSPDNVVRAFYPYATEWVFRGGSFGDEQPLPALTVAVAKTLGFALSLTSSPQQLRFHYLKPNSVPIVPLYQIFVPVFWDSNFKGGEYFKGKTVMIGATATILQDIIATPFGEMPGPLVQLNVLSAMKRGAWIEDVPYAVRLWSIPITGFLVFLVAMRRKSVTVFVVSMAGLGALGIVAFFVAYQFGSLFLPIVHPLAAILLCGLATAVTDVSLERKERGRLRGTLERYVSKDVVREIVENPTSYLHTLGGQRKEVVVLFCDLRGFTTASETLDAAFMVSLLNEYFGEMVEAIFQRRGEVNKFIGDALLAIWGGVQASTPGEDARQAVGAALDMKERRIALNARRSAEGRPAWGAGMGITQGPVIFGNVGAQERMEPAVIGDTVNLASRIENLTRVYDCDILIDERVATHVRETCELLLVDIVRVKGRRAHDTLFFPFREADPAWCEAFIRARLAYIDGRFTEAAEQFASLTAAGPAPGLAECYRRRCEGFLRQPPAADWDGIWDFLEKK